MPTGPLLREIIDEVKPQLESLNEPFVSARPAPGKWCAKEIIGHLIDSAVNNHRRFITAADKDNLIFDGYDQVAWVERQQYRGGDWQALVGLWYALNSHLAYVVDHLPKTLLSRLHDKHNFDRIAMRVHPTYASASLEYLVRDYVWHLEHHLVQILPKYERKLHW